MRREIDSKLLTGRPEPAAPDVAGWMARLRNALFEAVTEEDVRAIAEGLVRRAKEGDLAATRLLLSYVVGRPSVRVKNAVIVNPAPLPTAPARALPGSAEKLEVLTRRAAAGQPLQDPRDAVRDAS